MKKDPIENQKFVKEIVEKCVSSYPDGFHLDVHTYSDGSISLDLDVCKVPAKPMQVKKEVKTYDALDAMYSQPKTEEQIAKETEERNRKLKEKFNNQGNVIPNGGQVAAWTGEE